MIPWFLKIVSAITSVPYKSVRYIENLLWEFDRDSTVFYKICSLKRGACYIGCPMYRGSTVVCVSQRTTNCKNAFIPFNRVICYLISISVQFDWNFGPSLSNGYLLKTFNLGLFGLGHHLSYWRLSFIYRIPSNLSWPLISADGPFSKSWTNLFSLIISTGTVLRIFVFLLI